VRTYLVPARRVVGWSVPLAAAAPGSAPPAAGKAVKKKARVTPRKPRTAAKGARKKAARQ
jgi:hypothetical protein